MNPSTRITYLLRQFCPIWSTKFNAVSSTRLQHVFCPAPEWKGVYGVTCDNIKISGSVVSRFKMIFSDEGAERVSKAFQEDFESGGLTKEMVDECGGMSPEMLVVFTSEGFQRAARERAAGRQPSPTNGSPWGSFR